MHRPARAGLAACSAPIGNGASHATPDRVVGGVTWARYGVLARGGAVTRTRAAGLASALLAIVLSAAGCSAGRPGESIVFTPASFTPQGMRATTIDVVDVSVLGLHNITGHSVRLRSVSLVSVPRAVQVRSVTAYRFGIAVGMGTGDLLKYCRKQDRPYQLADVVTRPQSDWDWYLVIAMSFTKPGRYNLGRAKISYTSDGHQGWQYLNLNMTMVITTARKGTKPAFDGC
jgi:hypothetical protein